MRADVFVTIFVGMLLSAVLAWCMCSVDDADKKSETNKREENDDAKK